MFIAIDACFRLKRKLVSSVLKDPYLAPGWAYFVEQEAYRKYLLTVTDQDEVHHQLPSYSFYSEVIFIQMSTCTGLAALDYANTRFSKGYAITGIGMCCCARHELIGKNAAVPLQKGERCVICSKFRAYANVLPF